jgi:hypothetical protein
LPSFTISDAVCGNGITEADEECDGQWYCDAQCGLSRLKLVSSTEQNPGACLPAGASGGVFRMKPGTACQYAVNSKDYVIKLLDVDANNFPRFAISPGNNGIVTGYSSQGRYFVDDDFALRVYEYRPAVDKLLGSFMVELHKIIPTSAIKVIGNCGNISDATVRQKCEQYLADQKNIVLPALDKVTGFPLGRCYDEIDFDFSVGNDHPMGEAFSRVGEGNVTFQKSSATTPNFFGQLPNLETHELLHLADDCLNIPVAEEANHSFWEPKISEIYKAAGFPTEAATHRDNTQYWVDHADPATTPGAYGGCYGVKTLALYRRYLTNTNTVSDYFWSLMQNVNQLAEDSGNVNLTLYNQLTANLLGDGPEAVNDINKYCAPFLVH